MKIWWLRVVTGMALFGLSVGNGYAGSNTPPIAEAGGPYNGVEGSTVTLDGSASFDLDGDPLLYIWDFGDSTGAGPTGDFTSAHTYVDSGIYTVMLTVDDGGSTDSDTATATIDNVSPTVDPIADFFTESGLINLLVSFTDPGIQDNPWTYAFDWGDGTSITTGSTDTISLINASHTYAGSVGQLFTGNVSITDKDGGVGRASFNTTIVSSVPEPATLALLSLGLAGLGFTRRKMKA